MAKVTHSNDTTLQLNTGYVPNYYVRTMLQATQDVSMSTHYYVCNMTGILVYVI